MPIVWHSDASILAYWLVRGFEIINRRSSSGLKCAGSVFGLFPFYLTYAAVLMGGFQNQRSFRYTTTMKNPVFLTVLFLFALRKAQ
jgi:hypothetical protein